MIQLPTFFLSQNQLKISAKRDDDNLGTRIVQFSENRYKRYDL